MNLAALDIGSNKVCAVLARVIPPQEGKASSLEIIGVAKSNASGVKNGNLIDLNKLTPIIKNTIQEAVKMAGLPVERVCVNINGEYIDSFNVRGVVSLVSSSTPRSVEQRDVQRVRDSAMNALSIPNDRSIIHMLPQQYLVDDVTGIRNPIDMQASRLEAEFHVVTASHTVVNNLYRTLEKVGLEIITLVLTPLAAAYGVVTEYEREQGVLLIEIGADTTGMVIMKDNSLYHSRIINLGGHQFTSDLATVLGTSIFQAERLKRTMSSYRYKRNTPTPEHATDSGEEVEDLVNIPNTEPGGQPQAIPRTRVKDILDARSEELMLLIRDHMADIHMIDMVNYVVLTGGGSLILGLDGIAQSVFDLPTRIGYPVNIDGLKDIVNSPVFSVGVGMMNFVVQQEELLTRYRTQPTVWKRLAHWFKQVLP